MEREEALELARSRLIVALDVGSAAEAHELVDRLAPAVSFFKVGLELFTAAGPPVVEALVAAGHRCFLDLKLLDIPATVARATAAAARLGAELLTVHADPAAVAAAAHGRPGGRPRILVVGLLTSAGAADAAARVAAAARIAAEAGADGVVAAARPEEIDAVRRASPALTVVCPGIRPAGAEAGDQRRVATPAAAMAAGADYLVVGRPIRDAADPRAAAEAIAAEMAEGLLRRAGAP